MEKQKIHFISYGNHVFKKSLQRIKYEAEITKWFDYVNTFSPIDLNIDFTKKFNLLLNQRRGGGYWIWKVQIIKQYLKKVKENDILVYLDAGCTINIKGEKWFKKYITLLNENENKYGIISFQMEPHLEKTLTIEEIFDYFDVKNDNNDIRETGQYVAGILVMKKNKHLMNILDEFSLLINKYPFYITDYHNKNQKNDYFKENRHDQSILSVLRKKYGSIVLKDQTYFEGFGEFGYGNFGGKTSLEYPFWATRRR